MLHYNDQAFALQQSCLALSMSEQRSFGSSLDVMNQYYAMSTISIVSPQSQVKSGTISMFGLQSSTNLYPNRENG